MVLSGVFHPASATICPSGLPVSHGLASLTPRLASVTVVVGQPANVATPGTQDSLPRSSSRIAPSAVLLFFSPSTARGVGHPIKSVTDVRPTDPRRRERDRPEGVTQGFQVSVYKVDPRVAVFACNLLSKDDCRLALFDEVVKGWPQVPLVIKPSAFACRAERLARTGTSPNRSVVAPSGRSQGMAPNADTSKEVALGEAAQVAWVDIFNTPFINIAGGDVPSFNQVAQPLSGCWVNFVVVGGHGLDPPLFCTASEDFSDSRTASTKPLYAPLGSASKSIAHCLAQAFHPGTLLRRAISATMAVK
jgi:hypothetical protein